MSEFEPEEVIQRLRSELAYERSRRRTNPPPLRDGKTMVPYETVGTNSPQDEQLAAQSATLERERLRLAACGVVAIADTPESAIRARAMADEYKSASCDDVARCVDECMKLRSQLATAERERDEAREAARWLYNRTSGEDYHWACATWPWLEEEPHP